MDEPRISDAHAKEIFETAAGRQESTRPLARSDEGHSRGGLQEIGQEAGIDEDYVAAARDQLIVVLTGSLLCFEARAPRPAPASWDSEPAG